MPTDRHDHPAPTADGAFPPVPPRGHLPAPGRAVYGISVAAELAGIGAHTLRLYEQHGLLTPARSSGGTRRYSDDDLERLARISSLAGQGVNLVAIARILDLEDTNTELRHSNAELTAERDRLRRDPR